MADLNKQLAVLEAQMDNLESAVLVDEDSTGEPGLTIYRAVVADGDESSDTLFLLGRVSAKPNAPSKSGLRRDPRTSRFPRLRKRRSSRGRTR